MYGLEPIAENIPKRVKLFRAARAAAISFRAAAISFLKKAKKVEKNVIMAKYHVNALSATWKTKLMAYQHLAGIKHVTGFTKIANAS